MNHNHSDVSHPQQAPDVDRTLRFHRVQLIGVPLLLLLPLLALFGVFGESWAETNAANETFALRVEYPSRYRYKMINSINVSVENISAQSVPTATVGFDEAYVSQFSTVSFTPSVEEVTSDAYIVQLTDVKPGETRIISVELQGEQYGRHHGNITVTSPGSDRVEVAVETIIFP